MKRFVEYCDKLINEESEIESPFAVFLVGNVKGRKDLFAATTRAKDRGESGKIGLPGGKVDIGETPIEAVKREAYEEGWKTTSEIIGPIHKSMVEGKMIWWFKTTDLEKLQSYKEDHRILNIERTLEEISKSGYGNEFLANNQI